MDRNTGATMSQDINHVTLIGRLTRDAELVNTKNGGMIAKFTLASNRPEKRGDSWQESVGYFDCQLWGKRAEAIQKHTSKGSRICVHGNLKWESWTGTDGKKNSKVVINVTEFQFLDQKQSGDGRDRGPLDGGSFNDDTARRFRDDEHVMSGEPPF